jgi:RHS repeat-associated protein
MRPLPSFGCLTVARRSYVQLVARTRLRRLRTLDERRARDCVLCRMLACNFSRRGTLARFLWPTLVLVLFLGFPPVDVQTGRAQTGVENDSRLPGDKRAPRDTLSNESVNRTREREHFSFDTIVKPFLALVADESPLVPVAQALSGTFFNGPIIFTTQMESEANPACGCSGQPAYNQGISLVSSVCPQCETARSLPGIAQDVGRAAVFLHSGEATLHEVDLEIPGRGFNWKFERKYRSGISFDGPLGHNWEFNYNRRLFVENNRNVIRMDGYGRADRYILTGAAYQAPAGFYTQLKQNPDGTFVERDRSGTKVSYSKADNRGIAWMTELRDRNGNQMRFEYNAPGQLVRVIETLGRAIDYHYNAEGRLTEVEDFNRRKIQFAYDSNGDLEAVTSPAVTGTPNRNDFPAGKATRYRYSSGARDEQLNHNLVEITAPNNAGANGSPRVKLEYETNLASPDVDRVLRQTVGGVNASGVPAGGTISYEYRTLGTAPPNDFNTAVFQTTVTDRNGNRTEYQSNQIGNIVRVRKFANRRIRVGDPALFETQYEYNKDGQMTRLINPEGNSVDFAYDERNPDRFQQGNLLSETRTPDRTRGGDQAFTKTTSVYEPIYNRVRTTTEPRGNDPAYVPQNGGAGSAGRYTAVYIFDYQEGADFAGLARELGVSKGEIRRLLKRAGIQMGLGDVNGDGRTDQIAGNVVKVVHPTVTLLKGSNLAQIEGGRKQPIEEVYTYNNFGQLTSHRDPEGNITLRNYHPENDPDGDGKNPTPGVGSGPFGYLKEETHDAVGAPDRDSKTNPPSAAIRRQFMYDAVGNVIRETDGRGIVTRYFVNQLNQVVQIIRAAAVPSVGSGDPAEPIPLTAFVYLENIFYDANDNVIKREVEDRGDTSNTGGFVERTTKYDILDQPIEMGEEVSISEMLTTRYRYDANGNRTLALQPEGNGISTVFDERDLPFQTTRGATVATPATLGAASGPYNPRGGLPSTATYNYDRNRNLIETVDAADTDGSPGNNSSIAGVGDVTKFRYDGFDRRVATTDAVGNMATMSYDPVGNVVKETRSGPVGGPSPKNNAGTNNVQLSATEYNFDELNRMFQEDRLLFVSQGVATVRPPSVTEGPLTPGDNRVTTRYEYDRNSRRKFVTDDAAHTYRTDYDGAGRVRKTVDPEGNTVETAYDDNNNVIETRETDVSQVPGVLSEIFLTTNFYDSLNRLQRSVDNLGQTMEYRYDSRSNLVATADAKGPVSGASIARRVYPNGSRTVNTVNGFGNVTIYFYDGINRRTRQDMILTASGEGDGTNIGADIFGVKTATPAPDVTQGGGDGKITIRSEWDRNSLLRSMTDDNGNQTQYTYDNLNRRLTETKGVCVPPKSADRCDPPTTISYEYDPDDNVVKVKDENGSVTELTFDAINRRIACQITRAPGVVGTTAVSYEYDGLSRMTRATDNNEPLTADDDSVITYAYDSLSRVIEETQKIGALPAKAISSGWNADNHRVALTYPNERVVKFTYDGLDRLNTVADQGAAQPIADYEYIGVGRVAQRRYPINGTRMTYLNDAGSADVGYDGLRRPVELRHLRNDNSLIVGFTHTFDRMNNKLTEGKLHNPPNSESYGYDSAYRLISFKRAPGGIAPLHSNWALDGVGNWRQVDAEIRQHSSFNEITQHSSGGAPTTIVSDDNGNETDDGAYLFKWDYRNRLRSMTRESDGALIAEYSYDAAGRRIRKVVTNSGPLNGTTQFYLDRWRETEERDGADALVQQYVYGVYIDEPLVLDRNLNGDNSATGSGDRRLFCHQNTLASVSALTDGTGTIVEGYQYDAYSRPTVFRPGGNGVPAFGGNDVVAVGGASTLANPYLFTGRRLDGETELYHYRNRYLNMEQGRFVTRDPIGVWGEKASLGDAYSYVGNGPTTAGDPLGLDFKKCVCDCWREASTLGGLLQINLPCPLDDAWSGIIWESAWMYLWQQSITQGQQDPRMMPLTALTAAIGSTYLMSAFAECVHQCIPFVNWVPTVFGPPALVQPIVTKVTSWLVKDYSIHICCFVSACHCRGGDNCPVEFNYRFSSACGSTPPAPTPAASELVFCRFRMASCGTPRQIGVEGPCPPWSVGVD